jgi:DNA-binding NarL/FixJ family response regulator
MPLVRLLMLTTFGLDSYVYEALRAGASGFMLKDAPPEEIAAAVKIIASGEALLTIGHPGRHRRIRPPIPLPCQSEQPLSHH